ncbi:KAP family P-loop NTPase fold protein [Aeromonas rivipollensis]|uniref:KAP family P-loop NTPase fold protein n=1 Tax=Aeromonas rivipollensis TaxID=948519 RepID=UPI003D2228F4
MNFKASKIRVPDDNPFLMDKLNLQSNISNLSVLLKNLSSPITLSINSPWGTGKSTFIEMLSANIKNSGCNTVVFSAWHTDFAGDPLLAFLGEINEQINKFVSSDLLKSKAWSIAKRAGTHLIKRGFPSAVKIATAGMIDFSELVENEIAESTKELSSALVDKYTNDKEQIEIFKNNISKIFNNPDGTGKLYIFIDELDRCRPTYAIELLERIKHLFDIEGLVFILAMDKNQLSHSVKSIYGSSFDSAGYLRRFIDIEYQLPPPDIGLFVDGLYKDFDFDSFFSSRKSYDAFRYDWEHLSNVIKLIAKNLVLSLRDIEFIFAKINLILRSVEERKYFFPAITAFLIITKEYNPDVYSRYIQKGISADEIIEYLYSIVPESIRHSDDAFECALIEAFLLNAKENQTSGVTSAHIERHKKIINENPYTSQVRSYSDKVVRIYERPAHDYDVTVSIDRISSRISLLDNFIFTK